MRGSLARSSRTVVGQFELQVWADSARSGIASGRTGVRAKAVIPCKRGDPRTQPEDSLIHLTCAGLTGRFCQNHLRFVHLACQRVGGGEVLGSSLPADAADLYGPSLTTGSLVEGRRARRSAVDQRIGCGALSQKCWSSPDAVSDGQYERAAARPKAEGRRKPP